MRFLGGVEGWISERSNLAICFKELPKEVGKAVEDNTFVDLSFIFTSERNNLAICSKAVEKDFSEGGEECSLGGG